MNDGTFCGGAQAFKINTLLKLSDVKGIDEKTELIHFVVQEIIRSEDKVCIEVKNTHKKISGTPKKDNVASKTSQSTNLSSLDLRHKLFPAITYRRINDSS
ncbi:hypothetical protein RDI58_024478 [Solanum bulbocastanum]|uniref:FH2 domain-containing protein n=1 Tax=Solanum bulbocastanum TaxID=147425 RepID=A0AAN8Y308_SOLBU